MRYEIYVDGDNNSKGKLLHDSRSSDTKTKVENCILNLEDSKAGSLNFDIDPEHPYYNSINRVTSYVDFYQNEEEIWSGRVMQEEIDFNNVRIIYCEGELSYLNDTCQPQMEYKDSSPQGIVQKLLDVHNQRVDDRRKFYLKANGASFPPNVFDDITFTTQYSKTLDSIQNLMSKYNWHVHVEKAVENGVRKRFLVFTEQSTFETNTSQVIEFGKNLVDYTGSFDMSEIATAIIPLGQKISSAGQTLMGDVIPWDAEGYDGFYGENQYYSYNQEDGIQVHTLDGSGDVPHDESARGYCIGDIDIPRSMWSTAQEKKYLYFTGRSDGGKVIWFFRQRDNQHSSFPILGMKTANNSVVTTDSLEEKVEIPVMEDVPEGVALRFHTSGLITGITLRVNAQKEVDQVFDEYTTVESVNNDSVYVIAQSINLFKPGLIPGNVNQTTGAVELSTERYVIEEPIDISAGTYTISWLTKRSSHEVDIYFYTKDDQGNLTYQSSESLYNNTTTYTFTIANDRTARFVFKRRDYSAMANDDIYDIQLEKSNVAHPYESPLTPLDTYGWFERQVTWDDTQDPQTLLDRAVTYLKSGQFDKMVINIKAYDLSMMIRNIDAIKLGQAIRVTSKPHGLDRFFDVTKISINVSNWQQTIYTLGYEQDFTLTASTNQINDALTSLISGDTHNALIAEMKLNAVAQIIGAMNGTVTTLLNDNNKPIAHFYSQSSPSTVYWSQFTAADCQIPCLLLNYEGIGFFANGIGTQTNRTPPTITLVNGSGQIVANAIAAGTMLADRIRGGTLDLVGYTDEVGQDRYAKITVSSKNPNTPGTTQWWDYEKRWTTQEVNPYPEGTSDYADYESRRQYQTDHYRLDSTPGAESIYIYDGSTTWTDSGSGATSKPHWILIDDACIIGGDFYQDDPNNSGQFNHYSETGAIWPNFSWGDNYSYIASPDLTGVCIAAAGAIGFASQAILVSEQAIGDTYLPSGTHGYRSRTPMLNSFYVGRTNHSVTLCNVVTPHTTTVSVMGGDGQPFDLTYVDSVSVDRYKLDFVHGIFVDEGNA